MNNLYMKVLFLMISLSGLFCSCTPAGSGSASSVATVAAPEFFPDSGVYANDFVLEISCATTGAVIYYTTDGTIPDINSSVYSSGIPVNDDGSTLTVMAYASAEGLEKSPTVEGDFSISISSLETPLLNTPEADDYLDNGGGGNPGLWQFDWEDVPGAEGYYFDFGTLPVRDDDDKDGIGVDDSTGGNSYYNGTVCYDSEYSRSFTSTTMLESQYWRVQAFCGNQTGAWSEVRAFTVEPPVPNNLTVFDHSDDSITLTWSYYYSFSDAEYLLYRSESEAGPYLLVSGSITSASYTDISYTDTSVSQGQEYFYRIAAVVDGNESDMSEPVRTSAVPGPMGYFKVANSWGNPFSGEKVGDGFYYITYEAMKLRRVPVYIYADRAGYTPQYVAKVLIDHDRRNACNIYLGVGDPEDPVAWKSVSSSEDYYNQTYTTYFYSSPNGSESFPASPLVIDVSEFAQYMGNEDFFLRIRDKDEDPADGTEFSGSIISFSLEEHSTYNYLSPEPSDQASAAGLPMSFDDGEIVSIVIPAEEFEPVPVTSSLFSVSSAVTRHAEVQPISQNDLQKMKDEMGTADPDKDYNRIVNGMGTGWRPPTEEEWEYIAETGAVLTPKTPYHSVGASITAVDPTIPTAVDWSEGPYFPPIGSQGSEGSCVSWSVGYYIKTFQEAYEHERNVASAESNGYKPSSLLDWIYSPDFIYHQINNGENVGTSYFQNQQILDKFGCASWDTMPYSASDHTSWPDETAWREAPLARSSFLRDDATYGTDYYFTVTSDDEINLLRSLLAEGVLVSITIDSTKYSKLDGNDIWDADSYNPDSLNHANTVVGYEDVDEY